jgi:Rrf2 family iron-sulfur cluster assembly transcriptional regulator
MKLSTRARYALRMMLEITRRESQGAVSLGIVSHETDISRRYLDQLAMALKQAGLVRGRSGKGGGYVLTRSAEAISVGQIVEAAIGPINIVECVRRPETCGKSDPCECRMVYQLINQRISEVLEEISLATLADTDSLMELVEQLHQVDERAAG